MIREVMVFTAAIAGLIGCSTLADSRHEAAARVVPIEAEPNHKIRFDNGRVRVYEVVLEKGQATLVHEHRADSFAVIFGNAEFANEPSRGEARKVKLPNGFVGFSPATAKPYAHRAVATGDGTFHVAVLELLGPAPVAASTATPRADPPFKVARESPRGRAYRISLAPGASTPMFTRPAGSMVFAVSAGRVKEESVGRPARLWDFGPGHFRWYDTGDTVTLRNEGSTAIDLVEIDVF